MNGGGLVLFTVAELKMENIQFINNSGFYGGGIHFSLIEGCVLKNILFTGNDGKFGGAGNV